MTSTLAVSPDHAEQLAQIGEFFERCEAQEKFHLEAGLPAAGTTDFLRSWFTAWQGQNTSAIVDHTTDEVAFVDPGTNGLLVGKETLRDYTNCFFRGVPDLVFYPQDVSVLPYWDFFGGTTRVTLPWRAIGRFTGTLVLPDWPAVAPTGRTMNFTGIDRYVFTDDFKIKRIDTDYDMVGILQEIGLLPNLRHPSIRGLLALERGVAPLLRRMS